MTTENEIRKLIDADPAAREPNLVLADWLSEKGDPRGELGTLHDRIIDARRRGDHLRAEDLLRAAFTLVSTHVSEWVGFDVEVLEVVDTDHDLIARTDLGRIDLRWSMVVGLSAGVDQLAMAFGRPACALRTIHGTRLLPGQLWRLLEKRSSDELALLSVVGVSDSKLDEGDVRMLAGLPSLRGFFGHRSQGLDTARLGHLLRAALSSLILVDATATPAFLYSPAVDTLEELVLFGLADPVVVEDLGRIAGSHRLRRLGLSPLRELDDGVLSLLGAIPTLRSLELLQFPALSRPDLEKLAGLTKLEHVVLSPVAGDVPRIGSSEMIEVRSVDLVGPLSRLPFVRGLDIRAPAATDGDLACLRDLPDLRAIEVRDCPALTGRFLQALPAHARLSFVRIAGCPQISEDDLLALASCRSLRQLSLDAPITERLLAALEGVPLRSVRCTGLEPDRLRRWAEAHAYHPMVVSAEEELVPDRVTFLR